MFDKRSHLVKFLAVADSEKIFVAADKLAITQSVLTRVIAKIEKQFGVGLFERLPTGIRLTPLGVKAADLARRILREIDVAEEKIDATLSGRTGSFQVAGRGRHAASSITTPFGFSFMRWPTISATSCAPWRCPMLSSSGR